MPQLIIHYPNLAGRFPCDDSLAKTSGGDECTDTEAEAEARHRRRANDGVLRASDGTLYTHDPRAATCGGCLVEEVKRLERDLRATQRQVEYHAKNANGYYRELTSRGWAATHGWPVDRNYCEKCSSTDVTMCTGCRQFTTITLACSCSCHAAVRVPPSIGGQNR